MPRLAAQKAGSSIYSTKTSSTDSNQAGNLLLDYNYLLLWCRHVQLHSGQATLNRTRLILNLSLHTLIISIEIKFHCLTLHFLVMRSIAHIEQRRSFYELITRGTRITLPMIIFCSNKNKLYSFMTFCVLSTELLRLFLYCVCIALFPYIYLTVRHMINICGIFVDYDVFVNICNFIYAV